MGKQTSELRGKWLIEKDFSLFWVQVCVANGLGRPMGLNEVLRWVKGTQRSLRCNKLSTGSSLKVKTCKLSQRIRLQMMSRALCRRVGYDTYEGGLISEGGNGKVDVAFRCRSTEKHWRGQFVSSNCSSLAKAPPTFVPPQKVWFIRFDIPIELYFFSFSLSNCFACCNSFVLSLFSLLLRNSQPMQPNPIWCWEGWNDIRDFLQKYPPTQKFKDSEFLINFFSFLPLLSSFVSLRRGGERWRFQLGFMHMLRWISEGAGRSDVSRYDVTSLHDLVKSLSKPGIRRDFGIDPPTRPFIHIQMIIIIILREWIIWIYYFPFFFISQKWELRRNNRRKHIVVKWWEP